MIVGEMRDAETADVALKAAQTGHLVLSTLHTNDASGAIARLLDIGVAPYHIAKALRSVTAQRLVRRLCAACRRRPSREPVSVLLASGLDPARLTGGWHPFVATGCEACHGIGYRGRIGVMVFSDSLREAALARVYDGTTSLDKACAVAEAG